MAVTASWEMGAAAEATAVLSLWRGTLVEELRAAVGSKKPWNGSLGAHAL